MTTPRTVLAAHAWKLLTDHRPNGDGLFAYGLMSRLAERGHRVHAACRGVDLAAQPPPGLVLHRLTLDDGDLGVGEQLRYMRRLRRLYDRLGREERIDVLWQPNPVNAGISLAFPRAGPPLVLGPYFADWPRPPATGVRVVRAGAQQLARRGLRTAQQRRAAALLLSTEAARAKVHVRGLPTALVPMGVDPGAFPPPAPAPPDRPPTAVFLANLRGHKGVFTLLEAWEQVARRLPAARLLLAGGGPEEAEVRRRVAASPAAGSIELVGPVDRHRVPEVLARADVSCQPAHGEPFGWSAVEAMASGLAVVATDAAGIGTVVPDAAGRKVPVGDAGALADALVELLGDRELRTAAGAAGRRAVERLYAWDRVIDTVDAVFDRVTKGSP